MLDFDFQGIADSVRTSEEDTLLKCLVDVAETAHKFLRPQLENAIDLCMNVRIYSFYLLICSFIYFQLRLREERICVTVNTWNFLSSKADFNDSVSRYFMKLL